MRILFMGTPDFAAKSLSAVIDAGHDVIGVFTQPDKPQGRRQVLIPSEVKRLAMEKEIPCYQPERLRANEWEGQIRDMKPDVIVVVAYGKILNERILAVPKLGCVNVHGSILPKYRGAAPIQWTVINGDETAGVTTMYMDKGMDTGDIIEMAEVAVDPNETSGELYNRLGDIGAGLLVHTLKLIDEGQAPRRPQEEQGISYAPMLDKKLALIDFLKSAREVHNLVRGLNPWPIAMAYYEGKRLKIFKTKLTEDKTAGAGVITVGKQLFVGCGDYNIELLEVQYEGKGRMSGADFMRGRRLESGMRLSNDC